MNQTTPTIGAFVTSLLLLLQSAAISGSLANQTPSWRGHRGHRKSSSVNRVIFDSNGNRNSLRSPVAHHGGFDPRTYRNVMDSSAVNHGVSNFKSYRDFTDSSQLKHGVLDSRTNADLRQFSDRKQTVIDYNSNRVLQDSSNINNNLLDSKMNHDTKESSKVTYSVFDSKSNRKFLKPSTKMKTDVFNSESDQNVLDHLVTLARYQGPIPDDEAGRERIRAKMVSEFLRGSDVKDVDDAREKQADVKPVEISLSDGNKSTKDKSVVQADVEFLNDGRSQTECAQRQWTEWTEWTKCSAHCGLATRFRLRHCLFIGRPQTGSVDRSVDCGYLSFNKCLGKDMQTEYCQGQPECVELSYWGHWSECSAICKGKVGSRRRVMVTESSRGYRKSDPQVSQEGSCEGWRDDCTGWSQWSACSALCANEVGTRERSLVWRERGGFYRRDDTRLQVEPCVGHRILCEVWSSWNSWSSCDCQKRHRTRDRKCERRFVIYPSIGIWVDNDLCPGEGHSNVKCQPKANQCPTRAQVNSSAGCVTGCAGLARGRYPSCRSCFHYWQCYSRPRERMCARRRRWDDEAQRCLARSSTCSRDPTVCPVRSQVPKNVF